MRTENSYDKHKTFSELAAGIDLFLAVGGCIRHVEDCTKTPPLREDCPDPQINRQMCLFAIAHYEALRGTDETMPAAPLMNDDASPLACMERLGRLCRKR